MHNAHDFLVAITVVLGVAALTTILFQWLKQPVVLGYLIAGLLIGPHVTLFPLVADASIVQTLSELGVILLMFSLGLEFSLAKLGRVGPTSGLTAIIQCSLMLWLGFVVGRFFGWTRLESLFTGAIIAISSTTIIAKAFDEQGIKGRLREIVVGVLIVEDLIAILLMATLTALALPFAAGVLRLAGKLGAMLAEAALPTRADGKVDLAAAPRRVLLVTLQLAIVLLVGIPVVAVTQPFLAGFPAALVLLLLLVAFAIAFWRGATNLEGHVRAGAQLIVEALSTQSHAATAEAHSLSLGTLLPGLGEPTTIRLEDQHPAVGKTLVQLNLRGLTGATVLAISREGESVQVPTAQNVLRAGDLLALAGTEEAIAAAKSALTGSP